MKGIWVILDDKNNFDVSGDTELEAWLRCTGLHKSLFTHTTLLDYVASLKWYGFKAYFGWVKG